MKKDRRAETRWNGFGPRENTFAGKQSNSPRRNYTSKRPYFQCSECRSDYQKLAVGGICQGCLQENEHVFRSGGTRQMFGEEGGVGK